MRSDTVPFRSHSRWAPTVEAIDDFLRILDTKVRPVLDLFSRLWLAQAFFASGAVKSLSWASTVAIYTYEHPIPGLEPETAAVIGTAIELICPLLLAIGLLARFSAIPLLSTTLFLQLTYQQLDTHVWQMLLLGVLVLRGPGAIALDPWIAPHLAASALPFGRTLARVGGFLEDRVLPPFLVLVRVCVGLAVVRWEMAAMTGASAAEIPHFSAIAVLASVMLVVGLLTRVVATILLLAIAAAYAVGNMGEDNLVLLMLLMGGIILSGAGPLALDRLLAARIHRFFPSLSASSAWLDGAPQVVIVGAGFGGVCAALGLRHAWARVTVIDRRNYHLFQPLLYQVATATLSPADIATPIRALLRGQHNARTIMGRVTGVDTEKRVVLLGDHSVAYDYLILATGARHSYFGKDEWESFAPGLKKIDDATQMRGRILSAFERAEATSDDRERQRLMSFVIVGAGPTGVELAGAIAELARHGMRDEFRSVDPAAAKVILVQSAPRVLPAMPERLSVDALSALSKLGVDVRLNARVESIDAGGVMVNGERIEAATVLWAAGVIASPAGRWLRAERDKAGRVIVTPNLAVPGLEGVYAIGDTAACPDGAGGSLPGIAPVAKQQGQYVARLIRARTEGRRAPGPFRYRDFGSMATIGRRAAVAAFPGLNLSGTLAWWIWGAVHVAFLVDVRSRIAVLLDWFWSYMTYNRSTRLITGAETTPD